MAKFKVGDKVKITGNIKSNCSSCVGKNAIVMGIRDEETTYTDCGNASGKCCYVSNSELELINDNFKNMNIKDKFATMFRAEPQKSFIKTGITGSNDVLTSDGRDIFLSWLLKKNGDDFKKEVVDGLLEEEKE